MTSISVFADISLFLGRLKCSNTDGAIILLGFLVAAIGLFISTLVVFLGPKVVIEMFRFFFKS